MKLVAPPAVSRGWRYRISGCNAAKDRPRCDRPCRRARPGCRGGGCRSAGRDEGRGRAASRRECRRRWARFPAARHRMAAASPSLRRRRRASPCCAAGCGGCVVLVDQPFDQVLAGNAIDRDMADPGVVQNPLKVERVADPGARGDTDARGVEPEAGAGDCIKRAAADFAFPWTRCRRDDIVDGHLPADDQVRFGRHTISRGRRRCRGPDLLQSTRAVSWRCSGILAMPARRAMCSTRSCAGRW